MSTPPTIHVALLDLLLHAPQPVSVEALAARLGVTPAAVHRGLEQLHADGCELTTHPAHGVSLHRSGLGAWQEYLRWRFAPPAPPDGARFVAIYRRLASTQDACRRLIESAGAAADAAIVVADEQTAGRGRLGQRWVAPPGTCVLLSRVVVAPRRGAATRGDDEPHTRAGGLCVDQLVFATAVAAAEALEAAVAPAAFTVGIKWPNDLLVRGRKLAGILVEALTTPAGRPAAIIGIGINVDLRPDHLPADAADLAGRLTSLALEGHRVDRLRVLATVIQHLDRALAAPDPAGPLDQWRRRSTLLGHDVRLRARGHTVQGHVIDLDPRAGLIVRLASGEIGHFPAATTTVL